MIGRSKISQEVWDNLFKQLMQQEAAQKDVTAHMDYAEVRELLLDLSKSSFTELSEEAKELALLRVEVLVTEFLLLAEEKLEDTSVFATPSFQSILHKVQCAHAKVGNEEVKERLIEALLERAQEKEWSTRQDLLDDVLMVLPKLPTSAVNALTLLYVLTRLHSTALLTFSDFEVFSKKVEALYEASNISSLSIRYLEYLKTLYSLENSKHFPPLEEAFRTHFSGLFTKSFTQEHFEKNVGAPCADFSYILMPAKQDGTYEFTTINKTCLEADLESLDDAKIKEKILDLYDQSVFSVQEVAQSLCKSSATIAELLSAWQQRDIGLMYKDLSPVGFMIASTQYAKIMEDL